MVVQAPRNSPRSWRYPSGMTDQESADLPGAIAVGRFLKDITDPM